MRISENDRKRSWQAIDASLIAGALLVWWGVSELQTYGITLFCGVPVLMGFLVGWIDSYYAPNWLRAMKLMLLSQAYMFALLLVGAFEGTLCLVMAFPITCLMGIVGLTLGVYTARSSALSHRLFLNCSPLVVLPLLMFWESVDLPTPPLLHVRSVIIVDAPIQTVWKKVISFPTISPPNELMFKAGISYPIDATISGTGVGAIRHCNFSTGTFVEPITTWDAPNLLQFSVRSEPEPMKELSPYKITPPHLKGYLQCVRGEFRLKALGSNRTEMIGTTWYRDKLWPQCYWSLWSDAIIHQVHLRVLNQIKTVSEHEIRKVG